MNITRLNSRAALYLLINGRHKVSLYYVATEFEVINGDCWLQIYTSRKIGAGTGIDVSRSLLESMRHLLRLVYNEGRL